MRRSVETNLLRESSPFAMRFQERVDEGTCATLSFRPCNMYNIKSVDVIVLGLQSTCCQCHPRTGVDTECPSSCSQSLIPIKLGIPLKLGVPFKLGIESRPWILLLAPGVSVKLGLAFRRLPLRSAMAF